MWVAFLSFKKAEVYYIFFQQFLIGINSIVCPVDYYILYIVLHIFLKKIYIIKIEEI